MFTKTMTTLTVGLLLAGAASAQSFSEAATCKLTNTAKGAALFEGPCTVTQSESGANTIFEIRMGDSEPFLFAGQRGQSTWMHGPEEVQFTDAAGGGIFRWGDFVLAVAE